MLVCAKDAKGMVNSAKILGWWLCSSGITTKVIQKMQTEF